MTTSTLSPGGEDGVSGRAPGAESSTDLEGLGVLVARTRRLPRLDRSAATGVVALVGGALLAVARLVLFARGDPSRFIDAGSWYVKNVDRAWAIHVFRGSGYDGQFFYRLALDPANLAQTAFGITFDSYFRLQRIGYPALAWLVSGGRGSLVPWALIAVNVAALGLLGFVAGALAREGGRHALAGLVLVFWGFAYSLSRDTAEIPTAALMLAGLLALRRRRPWWAAVLFAAAVLSRETTLLVVGAVALQRVWARVRRLRPLERTRWLAEVPWVVPSIAFTAWQAVIWSARGHIAATMGRGNLAAPLEGLGIAIDRDLFTIGQPRSVRDLVQLTVLIGVAALALASVRTSISPPHEKIALVVMAVLLVCLSYSDLAFQANQRSLDQIYLLAGVVLLGSRRQLVLPGILAAALWLAVAVPAVVSV